MVSFLAYLLLVIGVCGIVFIFWKGFDDDDEDY